MDITTNTRTKVITLNEHTSKSQSQIARIVGVSQPSVSRIIQKERESGTLTTERKGRCGRKAKMTPQAVQMLVTDSQMHPRKTSHELRKHLDMGGISVSSRTVRRCLVNSGRIARRPVKKQLLTDAMKKKRLEWAENYKEWTIQDWKKILFSDESHFYVQGQRSQYIRRCKGEPITEAHIDQYVKYPQRQMMWGSFSHKGIGSLYPVEGMMNSEKYIEVINEKVQPDMHEHFPNGDGIFQQDSAPCHKAKKVEKTFILKEIRLLDWPGNSPDLNPIENLWSIVKMELRKRDCTTLDKLRAAIINIWFDDPKIEEHCAKLVESMPERVNQVILNRGGHTKY